MCSWSGLVLVWSGSDLIWSGLVWLGSDLVWSGLVRVWSGSGLVWSGSGLAEDVCAGGDGGHGPDSAVEFPPTAERRDRRGAQQETRQQGELRMCAMSHASNPYITIMNT